MRWMILTFVLLTSISGIYAQDSWRYGYVTRNAEGQLVLVTIDPVTLRSRTATFFDSQAGRTSATTSPDGQWLLLWYNDYPYSGHAWWEVESVLRLVNLETGEIEDVAYPRYVDFMFDSGHFFDDYNLYPLWSPDSRYFTFLDFVYSMDTGEILPLTVEPLSRVWSPDSRYLAIADSVCRVNGCYGIALNLYEAPEMSLAQTAVYDDWIDACDLAWSTDQTIIAFDNHCSYWKSGLWGYGEIIQWKLATNEVSPLTSYTIAPWERDVGVDGAAEYSTLWLDDETLLVSLFHFDLMGSEDGLVPNPSTLVVGTAVYRFPSLEWEWLNDEYVTEWAYNPNTEQIAYEVRRLDTSDPENYRWEQERVEIATFNQGELTPQYLAPTGCDLQWSPDGAWLIYHTPGRDEIGRWYECQRWRSLIFVNGSTGQVSEISLPVRLVNFAGWLQMAEGMMPFFPMGTPTPIPTISGFG